MEEEEEGRGRGVRVRRKRSSSRVVAGGMVGGGDGMGGCGGGVEWIGLGRRGSWRGLFGD